MTSITRCPFDHAVITVRERMDEAAAIYARMGFTLTERSFHAAGSCNHPIFRLRGSARASWSPRPMQ